MSIELVTEERLRIVTLLREEAHECINTIEVMLASEYHSKLRDQWSRWSVVASNASRAAHVLELAGRIEAEGQDDQ